MNKQNANNPQTPRAIAQQKYDSARANLLFMIIATVINLALLIANSDTFLLFSATVPYFSLLTAQIAAEETAAATLAYVIGGGFAAAILLLYALSWVLSKKHSGWLTLALVLFGIDTLALVALYILAEDVSGIIDFAFHIWIVYYLITGLINGKKLKTLPEDEEGIEAIEGEISENAELENFSTPIGVCEEDTKHRVLLSYSWNGNTVIYRRVKKTNQLVINNHIYNEVEMLIEPDHELCARYDGHTVSAGLKGVNSFISIDGEVVAKKLRLY